MSIKKLKILRKYLLDKMLLRFINHCFYKSFEAKQHEMQTKLKYFLIFLI